MFEAVFGSVPLLWLIAAVLLVKPLKWAGIEVEAVDIYNAGMIFSILALFLAPMLSRLKRNR